MSSLDRADVYPSQITEGLISVVRRDCHWKFDFQIIIPNANQRITSFNAGFCFVYTYPFTLNFRPPLTLLLSSSVIFSMCV